MKFSRFVKCYATEIAFLCLCVLCFYIYFIVYMTPSRVAWYSEMNKQRTLFIQELKGVFK